MYVGTRHGNVRPGSVDLSSRCEFATFSKELQKPVAASRSRDGSASSKVGCWLLRAEVLNFPIKTSLAWAEA